MEIMVQVLTHTILPKKKKGREKSIFFGARKVRPLFWLHERFSSRTVGRRVMGKRSFRDVGAID